MNAVSVDFAFFDNSAAVISELQQKVDTALEAVGLQAEAHAKNNIKQGIPRPHSTSTTGRLRNSITHIVKDDHDDSYNAVKAVIIGTNVPYAIYNEYGTGKWATDGNGRKGWWVYVDDGSGKMYSPSHNVGKIYTEEEARRVMAILNSKFERAGLTIRAHMTEGMKPIHFLQRAIEEHKDEYRAMIEHFLKQ